MEFSKIKSVHTKYCIDFVSHLKFLILFTAPITHYSQTALDTLSMFL